MKQPDNKPRQTKKPKSFRKKTALIIGFLSGSKRFYLASIALAGITALAEMIQPQILRATVDNAIGGKPADFSPAVLSLVEKAGGFSYLGKHLWILAAAVLAVALIQVTAQVLFRVSESRASERMVKNMRDTLFSHIERLPFSWYSKNHTGDIIQRCTSDIDTVKGFVSQQLTSILRTVLLLVLSCIFMFRMNPLLTVVALFPMPFILLLSVLFERKLSQSFEACDENEGKLSTVVQENLAGVRVVRAFGREKAETEKFQAQNRYYTGLWEKTARLLSSFWCSSDVISGIQIMLIVVVGAWLCIKGSMTEGKYIAFISYNTLLVWPIRELGRTISELSKAGVSLSRICAITDAEPEQDAPGAAEAPLTGDIVFDKVCFGYEGSPEILHEVSFTVKAGTTLGILGGTGSGKSTLMLLLDKFYTPSSGRITVGGTDLRQIRTDCVRNGIGFVLQEPYLFSGTLRENLCLTVPGLSEEAMRNAARSAALDETVTGFQDGYDIVVGERGVTLSGGQKQRAAIARMLTDPKPILILDDSLSAVDTETDEKIRHALQKHFENATVILISHRITTLSGADRVLVLDHGRIAEEGTPQELKEADGIYRKIYDMQTRTGEEENL